MSASAPLQGLAVKPRSRSGLAQAGLLPRRRCECGFLRSSLTGGCTECKSKKFLQAKLAIGASNDPMERQADQIADQVLAKPAHPEIGNNPVHIQRATAQPTTQAGSAPESVDRVLASRGNPLEPALRQDMEQRFGYDFSRVRVHSDLAAGLSAQDVNARAYTAGSSVVFGVGQFMPTTREGRRLIAHELAHVVQQSPSTPDLTSPASAMLLQRADGSEYKGGGGRTGGGGSTDSWDEADPAERMFPTWTKMSLPTTLEFYHGTRWSVAQNIGRIEHRGIGDFAAGFYTHFEPENNPAALNRAKERGQWAARQDPQEPYAGVLNFRIPTQSFIKLLKTRSRVFPLRDLKQPDYAERQREWLSHVTTHGRESTPKHFADQYNVERWRHYELKNPAIPAEALTIGPFYTPRQGLPGQPPPRSEFEPKALEPATAPTRLQHQVAWANEGLDLLNNSPRVALQFDRKTGEPIDPPVPATVAPPPVSEHYTSQNPSNE